jgi:polar amino acid transport system permease protein
MTRNFGWSEFLFVLGGLRWTILLSLAAMTGGGVLVA